MAAKKVAQSKMLAAYIAANTPKPKATVNNPNARTFPGGRTKAEYDKYLADVAAGHLLSGSLYGGPATSDDAAAMLGAMARTPGGLAALRSNPAASGNFATPVAPAPAPAAAPTAARTPLQPFLTPDEDKSFSDQFRALEGQLGVYEDTNGNGITGDPGDKLLHPGSIATGLQQAEGETTFSKAQLADQARRAVDTTQEDMAGRGLFHSSVKDTAIHDIQAQETMQRLFLDDRLSNLRLDAARNTAVAGKARDDLYIWKAKTSAGNAERLNAELPDDAPAAAPAPVSSPQPAQPAQPAQPKPAAAPKPAAPAINVKVNVGRTGGTAAPAVKKPAQQTAQQRMLASYIKANSPAR